MKQWPLFNTKRFLILFFLSSTCLVFFSRAPYLFVYLSGGLTAVRSSEVLGSGGLYSIFTSLFFPLSLILPFIILKKTYKNILFLCVIGYICFDLIIIGTRGIPFFLIFYYLVIYFPKKIISSLVFCLIVAIFIICTFESTTRIRSGDPNFDWSIRHTFSVVYDNLELNPVAQKIANKYGGLAWATLFLLQYISHSINQFTIDFSNEKIKYFGSFLFIKDQLGIAKLSDRSITSEKINSLSGAGLYRTFYFSFIYDFGLLSILIGVVFYMYLITLGQKKYPSPIALYSCFIFLFSPIENYIYGGPGLIRFILFVFLWKILALPQKIYRSKV